MVHSKALQFLLKHVIHHGDVEAAREAKSHLAKVEAEDAEHEKAIEATKVDSNNKTATEVAGPPPIKSAIPSTSK